MDIYSLDVKSPIIGGYISSEQVDLLRIVMCSSFKELYDFVDNCEQINHIQDIRESIKNLPLEQAKRIVFRVYQDTMVYHNSDQKINLENKFRHCGIKEEDIPELLRIVSIESPERIQEIQKFIIENYPYNYEEIFTLSNHFQSLERDQLKEEDMYDEIQILSTQLGRFNSILVGSGRIYNVVNSLYDGIDQDKEFDYYYALRDLDFAYTHGMQVRFHSLLVREKDIFKGKTKEEILKLIREYVERTIDFITEYNKEHKVIIDGKEEPVINAVDLFNEIVSFDPNEYGEYYSVWEDELGITIKDILDCFRYAYEHKPEGVAFLYNEPFLENDERRKKVLEVLEEIEKECPGLIDTLGSQMHITITENPERVRRCFEDLKELQESGKKIQITEFDMSLGRREMEAVFGPNSEYTLEDVYRKKEEQIRKISEAIASSKVELSGVTYWSLTDGIDCNIERIRSNTKKGSKEIPTACGGLIPTHKKLIKKNELEEMLSSEEEIEQEEIQEKEL